MQQPREVRDVPAEPGPTSRPLRCALCCPAHVAPGQADLPSERMEGPHHSGAVTSKRHMHPVALGKGAGRPRGSHRLTLQRDGPELRGTHPAGPPRPQVAGRG